MPEQRIDHHGKIFTVRSEKQAMPVLMATAQHVIAGTVYLRPGERLKDVLNEGDRFIAVTDARVLDLAGMSLQYAAHFMTVNTAHLAWLMPSEDLISSANTEQTHAGG